MNIVGFNGWLLNRVAQLDTCWPGLLGHLFRASAERRHVIAAFLSVSRPARKFEDEAALGFFLTRATHDEILIAAFGAVPSAFRSCMRKGGSQPYTRWHYRYVYLLLMTDRRPTMRRLLPTLDRVNPTRLKVARALPDDLRRANVVGAVRTVRDARDFGTVWGLLAAAGVPDAGMRQAILTVRSTSDLRAFVARWSLKVAIPEHPVPASECYRPITTGGELREMALHLRNCSRTYVAKLMERRSAFAVVARDGCEAVVHLVRRGDTWKLDDIYGPSNDTADPELERWAVAYLADHGIGRSPPIRTDSAWASLQRLTGYYDFEAA